MKRIKVCCKEIKSLIDEEFVNINEHKVRVRGHIKKGKLTLSHIRKSNKKPTITMCVIDSEGGMDEVISLKYCPFCGKKLEILTIKKCSKCGK